ncbi:unnamed protein product, partial [Adineta steineri]
MQGLHHQEDQASSCTLDHHHPCKGPS